MAWLLVAKVEVYNITFIVNASNIVDQLTAIIVTMRIQNNDCERYLCKSASYERMCTRFNETKA